MNTIEIIAKWLGENGYDGLFCESECACLKDELAPCGEVYPQCEAGYRVPCDGELDCCISGYPCEFHIGPKS